MKAPTNNIRCGNTYFLDVESAAETARLMHQHNLLTEAMGGLFPELLDVSGIRHVLDLACGPGGWVLETAQRYSHMDVIGVDISEVTVQYAHAQAQAQKLHNAHFRVMDILRPLNLPDDVFDLVNARNLVGVLSPETWPQVLREAFRVCRPGGLIRLTECEQAITNSPSFERLLFLLAQAFHVTGRSFSPDGVHLGITPRLGRLLRDAGCEEVQHMAHVLDFSVGTELHDSTLRDCEVLMQLALPFLLEAGVTTEAEFHTLYQRMLVEMLADDFCGAWFILTVWGTKIV